MKKVLFVLSIVTAACLAAPAFPGYKCKDATKWDEYAQARPGLHASLARKAAMEGFASFQDMVRYADTLCDDKVAKGSSQYYAAIGGVVYNGRIRAFYGECHAMLKDASVYDVHFICSNDLAISGKDRYDAMIAIVLKYPVHVTEVGKVIKALPKAATSSGYPDSRILEDLKLLNRILSANLLGKDKDKWEPVIAALRTMMTTY